MRTLALASVVLFGLAEPTAIPVAGNADHLHAMSACSAWRVTLLDTVHRQTRSGLIPDEDAAAFAAVIEMMGRRCSSADPHRVSQLFAIVLDVLTDQRHQP